MEIVNAVPQILDFGIKDGQHHSPKAPTVPEYEVVGSPPDRDYFNIRTNGIETRPNGERVAVINTNILNP